MQDTLDKRLVLQTVAGYKIKRNSFYGNFHQVSTKIHLNQKARKKNIEDSKNIASSIIAEYTNKSAIKTSQHLGHYNRKHNTQTDSHLDVPVAIEKHVSQLKIPVYDLVTVQVAGRLKDLKHVSSSLVLRKPFRFSDKLRERLRTGTSQQFCGINKGRKKNRTVPEWVRSCVNHLRSIDIYIHKRHI